MKQEKVKVTERQVSDLKFTETNPVKRTKRGRDTISRSLSELGAGRSVLIDENDVLIAGNGTVEQAKQLGFTRVIEIEVPDRHTLIAVKKPDMTEDEKLRMAMFDNGAAKLAAWDAESISKIKLKGVSTEGILTDKEFDRLVLKDEKTPKIDDINYDGELKYYLIVECSTSEEQEEIFTSLNAMDIKVIKYESSDKGAK